MPAIVSKLLMKDYSMSYNCYELGHTWTPLCSKACTDIGYFVLVESLKMYSGLYLLGHLLSKNRFKMDAFIQTLLSIVRSSSFLAFNAFAVIATFCYARKIVGRFYIPLFGHAPALVASFMAIYLERPSRRSALAFYVANIASESVYKSLVAKNMIKQIPRGEIALFTFTMSLLLYLIKRNGFGNDVVSIALQIVLGKEEAKRAKPIELKHNENDAVCESNGKSVETINEDEKQKANRLKEAMLNAISNFVATLSQNERMNSVVAGINSILIVKHASCPHRQCSCLSYVTKSFVKPFLFGWLSQVILTAAKKPKLILESRRAFLLDSLRNKNYLNFGIFLGCFASLFKAMNCILRWSRGCDSEWHASIAAFIASFSMFFSPNSTVAQYLFWKCVETVFFIAVRNGYVKNAALILNLVYAMSSAQLFYVAVLWPSFMRSSYMKFLLRMTNNYLALLNRNIIDTLGTHSSFGFSDEPPVLQFEHTSRKFRETVLIWFIQ